MAERLVDEESLERLGCLLLEAAKRVESELGEGTGGGVDSAAASPERGTDERDGE